MLHVVYYPLVWQALGVEPATRRRGPVLPGRWWRILVIDPLSFRDVVYVDQDWDVATVHTYLKVRSSQDAAVIQGGLSEFVSRNVPTFNIAGSQLTGPEALEISLRPITDIHLIPLTPAI